VRVLLDECIDRRFAKAFSQHAVNTVPQAGWASLKNGELLNRAEMEFDVFITVDRGLPSQQKLSQRKIAVLVIRAKTNRLVDLLPLASKVLKTLNEIRPGQLVMVA
jgi:hypothetical protein